MAERNYRCKEGKIAIFLRRVEMLSFQPVATFSQRLNKKNYKKIENKKLVKYPNNFNTNQNYNGWLISLTKYHGFYQWPQFLSVQAYMYIG